MAFSPDIPQQAVWCSVSGDGDLDSARWEALGPWRDPGVTTLQDVSALNSTLYCTVSYSIDPRTRRISRRTKVDWWLRLTPEARAHVEATYALGGTDAAVACFESYTVPVYCPAG